MDFDDTIQIPSRYSTLFSYRRTRGTAVGQYMISNDVGQYMISNAVGQYMISNS